MDPSFMMKDKAPSGYSMSKIKQFTPQQMELFSSLFSHVLPQSFLSRLSGGDQSMFGEMEAPALRQFNQLQGQLASRFSGMGTGGRHSTGFQNTMSSAASEFAQDLQSRRQDLQRQALMDLMNLSSTLLGQRPFETVLTPKQQKPSFLQSLGGGLGQGLGMLGGSFLQNFGGELGQDLGMSVKSL